MMNQLHGIIFAYLSNPDLRELTQHREPQGRDVQILL